MRAGSCRLQAPGRPPCPRRPAELPMLTVSGRRPWLAALPAAHARSRRTHEAQRSRGPRDRQRLDGGPESPAGRDGGGRRLRGRGGERRGREGGKREN